MKKESIEKLLSTTLKKEFPNQVKKIIVNVDDLGFDNYIYVMVVLNSYEDVKYDVEIENYIYEISKYMGEKIDQVSFGLEN